MDPQIDPEMNPTRLIFRGSLPKKALKGPFKVDIDKFFQIDI